jgi:hypothetical protein
MRWRLDLGDRFEAYVDADHIREHRIRGTEFVSNGAVVYTISPFVYVKVTPVPTMRLTGGPRDGQVAAAPNGEMPFHAYFLPVVPLNEHGEAIAPVPPAHLSGLVEVYVHLPSACECWERRRPMSEHVYVWSRDPRAPGG